MELIGEGATSHVYKGVDAKTGKQYAVKVIKKQLLNESQLRRIKTEISIMQYIAHPHIVHMQRFLMTDDRYMIQMDLATGGDLEHLLVNKNGTYTVLPSLDTAKVFLKTAAALSYCHSLGVVHRDLKLDNILIQNDQPVIIDFGLAAINDNINKTMYSQKTMCGTPLYIAYEVTSGK